MTNEEIAVRLTAHDEQMESNTRRICKLEEGQEEMRALVRSVDKLAESVKTMAAEQPRRCDGNCQKSRVFGVGCRRHGCGCLPFSLIWIALSICAIILADTINYYVFHELPVPYYKLFGKTIIRFKNVE